jgi:hypothetical protein
MQFLSDTGHCHSGKSKCGDTTGMEFQDLFGPALEISQSFRSSRLPHIQARRRHEFVGIGAWPTLSERTPVNIFDELS